MFPRRLYNTTAFFHISLELWKTVPQAALFPSCRVISFHSSLVLFWVHAQTHIWTVLVTLRFEILVNSRCKPYQRWCQVLKGRTWVYLRWRWPFAPEEEKQTPAEADASSERKTNTRSPHVPDGNPTADIILSPTEGERNPINFETFTRHHYKKKQLLNWPLFLNPAESSWCWWFCPALGTEPP